MNTYRTHLCSELTIDNLDQEVTLSGWIDTIRDHGNLIFIDLRDNYGITQCVVDANNDIFKSINNISNECVIKVIGKVIKRTDETINRNLKTGEIEISAKHSLNAVPFLIYDPFYDGGYHLKPYGKDKEHNLSHIAATNFILMGMKVPDDIAPPLFV